MEGIWDIFKKTAFWKFLNESTVQVNLVVHDLCNSYLQNSIEFEIAVSSQYYCILPIKIRPENLFHSNNISVESKALANITNHNCYREKK